MAAGRCKSAATSIGLRPRSLISRPSLPQVVVLPEPCRPQSISTRHARLQVQRVVDRPHQVDQFLVDDADELLVGIERLEHRLADGLLADPADEVLDDRQADVGLEQGPLRPGRSPSRMFDSVSLPLPRKRLQRAGQAFLERFEHGRSRG